MGLFEIKATLSSDMKALFLIDKHGSASNIQWRGKLNLYPFCK